MTGPTADHDGEQVAALGFAAPVRLFSKDECALILGRLERETRPPAEWFKGHAASSSAYCDVAMDWRIVSRVCAVLGQDVVLWGASLVRRQPGQVHIWHTDIESSAPAARTVSVWIGLRDTGPQTSLKVVPGSHRFGITVQESAARQRKRRADIEDRDIAAWAAQRGCAEGPRPVPMQDGDALLFDGRLWHASANLSADRTRCALLLQYASADTPIRIPNPERVEWPFQFLDVQAPCLRVSGMDRASANRIVSPPAGQRAAGKRLASRIHPLQLPLQGDDTTGWKAHHQFRGSSATLAHLACHVSVLRQGKCPHPPHRHEEDEILLVLAGEVEVILPELQDRTRDGPRRLIPGEFAYYPAGFWHTLRAASEAPAQYLMLKWSGGTAGDAPQLPHGVFAALGAPEDHPRRPGGFSPRRLFEGPTAWLRRLRSHVSLLEPGAGYPPHADHYDVIIIVLEGEIETLGKAVRPHGVVFYAAGEAHGMHNPGSVPARYLVFELQGASTAGPRKGWIDRLRQTARSWRSRANSACN
jgi:quercetin dioxygenase-like cupin family protein